MALGEHTMDDDEEDPINSQAIDGENATIQRDSDGDSGFDLESGASSTQSINSDAMSTIVINGRTYSNHKKLQLLPIDEEEKDRQGLQHDLFLLTFHKQLNLAPLKEGEIHRVLDIGSGTGKWAEEFADTHPQAEVRGVDLSPHQPEWVPPNLYFENDDIEEDWNFPQSFNYIHIRMMNTAISDWDRLFKQCFNNLEPGGYLEVQDISFPILCDDSTLHPESDISRWSNLMHKAALILGRPYKSCTETSKSMAEVGFTNIELKRFKWPLNWWPTDEESKAIGLKTQINFHLGLEAMSLVLFTTALGWSADSVRVLCARVRTDMKNKEIHAYLPVHVVYTRKGT